MLVLGIESSCDETAAAVVQDGRKIVSNIVFSQEKMHSRFKGIVPEIASRAHVENINWVMAKALQKAGCTLFPGRAGTSGRKKITAIAVTEGPGLVGSLLVGKSAAEAASWASGLPLVGVNHLEAHLFSNLLEDKDLAPPFLGLIVSGGHTDLILVEDFGKFKVLGRTRDDAAGESFDKVANILGLGYPGGPWIDRYAKRGKPSAVPFTRPYLTGSWDFSFSGLKTAVLYYWQKTGSKGSNASRAPVEDVCASFQATVVDVLVKKTFLAAKKFKMKKVVVGGGVSANSELRERFARDAKKNGLKIYLPSKKLCTDNAAMIACAGTFKLKTGRPPEVRVDPSLFLSNW